MTPSDRKWNTYYGVSLKRYSMELKALVGYPAPVWVATKTIENDDAKKLFRKTG